MVWHIPWATTEPRFGHASTAQVDLAAQMADRVIASGASFCLIGDVRAHVK